MVDFSNVLVAYSEQQLDKALRVAFSAGIVMAQRLPPHMNPNQLSQENQQILNYNLLYTLNEIKRRLNSDEEL